MLRNVNLYNLKKWHKMLLGKSILHVKQDVGKCYSKESLKGYYNDLSQKVLFNNNYQSKKVPELIIPTGEKVTFPISVFQYGLGAYDLYLLTEEHIFKDNFILMADWALHNQLNNGAWNTFFYIYPDHPYSAMAQGEGVSLLVRAYKHSNKEEYLAAATKAIEFMLKPISEGGTTVYLNSEIYFQEYTQKGTVLNGWIFAIFGLFDYLKVKEDPTKTEILQKSIASIVKKINDFDTGYWSLYNLDGVISSPFYHKLHIAQLTVLSDIFILPELLPIIHRWQKYYDSKLNYSKAFIFKALQKLNERN